MITFPIIILAGGKGTRLYPLTKDMPKSMISIHGKPFMQYQLELLRDNGFQHVHLCLGGYAEQVVNFVYDRDIYKKWEMKITYSVDKPSLGTGGAVKIAIPYLNSNFFFITYGDSYLPIRYSDVENHFWKTNSLIMTVNENQNPHHVKNVALKNEFIWRYSKKRQTKDMSYVDYGLSILSDSMVLSMRKKRFDLSDVFKKAVKYNRYADILQAHVVDSRFFEIGSWLGLKEFTEMVED